MWLGPNVVAVGVFVRLRAANRCDVQLPHFLPQDRRGIDQLIGAALVRTDICSRLLAHDDCLALEFCISEDAWNCLKVIRATSLVDFCRQFLQISVAIRE